MFKLVISDDEGKTTIIPLLRDEITIGRKEGNSIRLTERNISRRHAKITRDGERFLIFDFDSYNGTLVNGSRVSGDREIGPNDKIVIGDYNLAIKPDVAGDTALSAEAAGALGRTSKYARLVVLGPVTPGREFDLDGYTYSIGRLGEANIDFEHDSVSPQHARLERVDNQWTIMDMDSAAGVRINDRPISDAQRLKGGDVVRIGDIMLRFVAPGEPYSFYETPESPAVPSLTPKKPRLPSWALAVLSACGVVVLAIAVVLAGRAFRSPEVTEPAPQAKRLGIQGRKEMLAGLIEQSKDLMQAEDWKGAVELLGKALKVEPGHHVALDLKNTATRELDNQALFEKGLEAVSHEDWEQAYRSFKRIPPSSHYASQTQILQARDRLFAQWFKSASDAVAGGDRSTAEVHVSALKEIDDVTQRQKEKLVDLERRMSSAQAEAAPDRGADQTRRRAAAARTDQGSSAAAGVAPEPRKRASPLDRAREKLLTGDQAAAIAILEKGGNSKPVLNLLAATYMAIKDRQGYLKTIQRYTTLYPDDPKSEQYRTVLDAAGR